jgi:hypothetical protein
MKIDKCYKDLEKSLLYQRNIKMHKNLWKPYTITLIISLMIIVVKGFI